MKRLLDVVLAGAALVILTPAMLVVAVSVRTKLGSPVLFVQQRPGLHGVPFRMYKFRTMLHLRSAEGELLSDAKRLTRFGAFLRSTSLDELPALFNVLLGQMSLVGPRPLLMEYLELYSPYQARRHEVRPGITGWAQVNGRNSISWEEKFDLDVWYVDHQSLRLDAKILLQTISRVTSQHGVSAAGQVSMPKFRGVKQ